MHHEIHESKIPHWCEPWPRWDLRDPHAWCPFPIGFPHYYFPRLARCHDHPHHICPGHLEPKKHNLPDHLQVLPLPHIRGNLHKGYGGRTNAPDNEILGVECKPHYSLEFQLTRTSGVESLIIETGRRYQIHYVEEAMLKTVEGVVKNIYSTNVQDPFIRGANTQANEFDYVLEVDASELNQSNIVKVRANLIRKICELVEVDESFELGSHDQSIDIKGVQSTSKLTITTQLELNNLSDDHWSPITLRCGMEDLPIGMHIENKDGHPECRFFMGDDKELSKHGLPINDGYNIISFIIDYLNGTITFIVNDDYIEFRLSYLNSQKVEIGRDFVPVNFYIIKLPIIDNIKFNHNPNGGTYIVDSIDYTVEKAKPDPELEKEKKMHTIKKPEDMSTVLQCINDAIENASDGDIIDGSELGELKDIALVVKKAVTLYGFDFGPGSKLKAEMNDERLFVITQCRFHSDRQFPGTSGSVRTPLQLHTHKTRTYVCNCIFESSSGGYYNIIETNPSLSMETSELYITNNLFLGTIQNNAISVYNFVDYAQVYIEGNTFKAQMSNGFRLSNMSDHYAHIVITDNSYEYTDKNPEYYGFMVIQSINTESFENTSVYINLLKYKGELIDKQYDDDRRVYYAAQGTRTIPEISIEYESQE